MGVSHLKCDSGHIASAEGSPLPQTRHLDRHTSNVSQVKCCVTSGLSFKKVIPQYPIDIFVIFLSSNNKRGRLSTRPAKSLQVASFPDFSLSNTGWLTLSKLDIAVAENHLLTGTWRKSHMGPVHNSKINYFGIVFGSSYRCYSFCASGCGA
ncbi:hypothetical protein AXFE_11010 [Acidithrix ferrooxidans]|uniref:Uncharacterized protein n=1 Tax=Acidithrix ferrooxidans TaxID=1280514 RepID=A0A0D8HJH0_9ACTN|nr:hypothetical protein AXFE_11010 [Acidithrix ferrooxidans]